MHTNSEVNGGSRRRITPLRARRWASGFAAAAAVFVSTLTATPEVNAVATAPVAIPIAWNQRWVRIDANLLTDRMESLVATTRSAKNAGATTILLSDPKVNLWFSLDAQTRGRWLTAAQQFRDAVRAEGMLLVLQATPVGYCGPLLFNDQNLVNASPVVDAPMVVKNGTLVALQTSLLRNGSFENTTGEGNTARPTDWSTPDSIGLSTFVDRQSSKDGGQSLRFENAAAANSSGQARAFTTVEVQPFQQYTLKFWARTLDLTVNYLGPNVTSVDGQQSLTAQAYSYPGKNSRRTYVSQPRALTTEWSEMSIPFNSFNNRQVRVGLGVWGWKRGQLWIDRVRVEATPTLNVVRRNSLPLTMTVGGRVIREGVDVSRVVDPLLGRVSYPGYYDTYHAPPAITVLPNSSLKDGDVVSLDAYHAQITMEGQVGCSWNDPGVFDLMKRVYTEAAKANLADGYLIDVEEVRTGGWEPTDARFGSSGAAFSAHIARVVNDAAAATGKPLYVWSDMFDPTHNAVEDYFQVKGTLDDSWAKLDPRKVTIVNWRNGEQLNKYGSASVKHFADLGFRQIVAGYYDDSVQQNFDRWMDATEGQPNIVGSMYTTWIDDFTRLPNFAQLWWN